MTHLPPGLPPDADPDQLRRRAKELLREHRHHLELLARTLLDKEVLLKSDLERLIGPRPYAEHPPLEHNSIPLAEEV